MVTFYFSADKNTPTQNIPTNPSSINQNNKSKNQDGIEIFE